MKFSIQAVYGWYRNLLRNPKYRWWAIIGTLVYLVSPIDIAPDFLPIVGQIDDVFLLTLLISEVSQVAIEGFKERKNKNSDDNTPNPTETPNSATDTIDVDAVSVK